MPKIHFDILTLFPHMIEPYVQDSILKRAQEKGLVSVALHDWRQFAADKHKHVDDTVYGGGSGMLLKVDPIVAQLQAIDALKARPPRRAGRKTRVIMMSPDGKKFNHKQAVRLAAKYDRIVLIAGRYEGFDARVEEFVDEKMSIGPYVLSGGELPALVIMEAVSRQIPGVLGHSEEAVANETFAEGTNVGEYPQYTRPDVYVAPDGRELKVPEVLLSGDHARIKAWREENKRKLR